MQVVSGELDEEAKVQVVHKSFCCYPRIWKSSSVFYQPFGLAVGYLFFDL